MSQLLDISSQSLSAALPTNFNTGHNIHPNDEALLKHCSKSLLVVVDDEEPPLVVLDGKLGGCVVLVGVSTVWPPISVKAGQ